MKKITALLLSLLLIFTLSVGVLADEVSSSGTEETEGQEEGFRLPAKYGDRWLTWKPRSSYIMVLGGLEGTFHMSLCYYYACPEEVCEHAAGTAGEWLNGYIPENFLDFVFDEGDSLWLILSQIDEYVVGLTETQRSDERVARKLAYFEFLKQKTATFTYEMHENNVMVDGCEFLPAVVRDFFESMKLAVEHIGNDEEYDDPTAWDTIDFGEPPVDPGEIEIPEEEEDESLMAGIPHILIVPNTEKVLRETDYPENGVSVLTAQLAQNEKEGMQFLVHFKKDIHNLKVTVSELKNENGDVLETKLYREYYHNMDSDFIASKEVLGTGWYADALIPMLEADGDLKANNVVDVYRHNNQGYWIDARASIDQPAGIYTGTVTVTCDEHDPIVIPMSVEVWNFAISTRPHSMSMYISQTYSDFWDILLDYRISNYDPPRSDKTGEEYVQEVIDWYNNDERVSCIFNLADKWIRNYGTDYLLNMFSDGTAKMVHDKLEEARLLDKVFYFIFDEAGGSVSNLKSFIRLDEAASEFWPDINTMWTAWQPKPLWLDSVGCYCPILGGDKETLELQCRDAIANGHTFWTYTCVGPTSPYPSYHINDYLLSPRMLRWMMMDCGVQGDSYWGVDIPWRVGTNTDYWDNVCTMTSVSGDGFLLYPGSVGDGRVERDIWVPSLRLTSARDGLEDYEYLYIMEGKLNAMIEKYKLNTTADALLDTYFTVMYNDLNDYNTDPETTLEMRRIMAADIMAEDGTFVAVAPAEDGSYNRVITVYAPNGTAVSVDGVILAESKKNGYSVYTASVNVPDVQKTVTVKVGDKDVTRILGSFDYSLEDSHSETIITTQEPVSDLNPTTALYIAATAVIVLSVVATAIVFLKKKN